MSKGTAHLDTGEHGEDVALRHLAERGWRLLDRNWRSKLGELDLVVSKGETLAFVEVKTRELGFADGFRPEDALTPGKLKKFERAARAWLVENEARAEGLYPRLDVITVVGEGNGKVVEHLEDAFEAGCG